MGHYFGGAITHCLSVIDLFFLFIVSVSFFVTENSAFINSPNCSSIFILSPITLLLRAFLNDY